MNLKSGSNTDIEDEKLLGQDKIKSTFQRSSNKISKPMIAGFLLIIAGILALIFWTQLFTVDLETIEIAINTSYVRNLEYNITSQQIKQTYDICGTIGCISSVFAILGGILAIKRRNWGIALISGIPQFILSLSILMFAFMVILAFDVLIITFFSFLGIVLIYLSKQEFQKKID